MVWQQREAVAPFAATALLLVINQLLPNHRLNRERLVDLICATGRALAELVAILAGVGFIISAFSVTGLAGTLANDLIYLAGNNTLILLLNRALTRFV